MATPCATKISYFFCLLDSLSSQTVSGSDFRCQGAARASHRVIGRGRGKRRVPAAAAGLGKQGEASGDDGVGVGGLGVQDTSWTVYEHIHIYIYTNIYIYICIAIFVVIHVCICLAYHEFRLLDRPGLAKGPERTGPALVVRFSCEIDTQELVVLSAGLVSWSRFGLGSLLFPSLSCYLATSKNDALPSWSQEVRVDKQFASLIDAAPPATPLKSEPNCSSGRCQRTQRVRSHTDMLGLICFFTQAVSFCSYAFRPGFKERGNAISWNQFCWSSETPRAT